MSNFNLNIFTPSGVVIKGLACKSLLIPTIKGEINILKGHTHIVSELSTGILTAKTEIGDRHFSLTSGLVKVLGSEVTILSKATEGKDQIDIERAQAAKAKSESRLRGEKALNSVEFVKFHRKLERAKTRIKLANLK